MKIFTVVLNTLLFIIVILSLVEGDWQDEDLLYFPIFVAAPVASVYAILRNK